MTTDMTEELGAYQGRQYFLHIHCEPDFNTVESFSVSVYYKDAQESETVEVARVDTAHGDTHLDKLWRLDEPKEWVDWSVWDAAKHLKQKWRLYAERYDKNRS